VSTRREVGRGLCVGLVGDSGRGMLGCLTADEKASSSEHSICYGGERVVRVPRRDRCQRKRHVGRMEAYDAL